MNTQQFKPSGLSDFINEQKIYSSQQMHKIHNSNRKLDQLQEKMKNLLYKNKSKKVNQQQFNEQPKNQQKFKQIDRYFQSSKKGYQRTSSEQDRNQNDDLLLQNSGNQKQKVIKNKYEPILITRKQILSKIEKQQPKFTKGSQLRQKSASLKIFNKKRISKQVEQIKLKDNETETGYHPVKQNKQKFSQLRFHQNNQSQKNSLPSPYFNTKDKIIPQINSQQLNQINQLQQMMLKSIKIKQMQTQLIQQQLKQIQQSKLNEYRSNVELQLELENVKKLNQTLRYLFKKQNINISNENHSNLLNSKTEKRIYKEITQEKQLLQKSYQKFQEQLKQIEEEQYKLKLQKKRQTFQFNSLQRQFKILTKTRIKRMKENMQHNAQKQKQNINDQNLNQENSTQRQRSSSNLRHKKNTSSYNRINSHQKYHQKALESQIMKSKYCTSRQRQTSPYKSKQSLRTSNQKVKKSTSCSVLNKNRHMHMSCQTNKNCQTNKILYSMVNELDKLKQIVNKEIVKTRRSTNQNPTTKKRRVIQLYNQSDKKQKLSGFR